MADGHHTTQVPGDASSARLRAPPPPYSMSRTGSPSMLAAQDVVSVGSVSTP
jgi:hypothetical protein